MEVSQKLQNRTAFKEQENKAGIAGVMGVLSNPMIPDSEDYHEFIRNISMPRDEEYVQLVAKQIELLNRKEELLAELAEFETEPETETDTQPGEVMPAAASEELHRESADTKKQATAKPETTAQKTVQSEKETKTPSGEEIRKKEIEAELRRLDEEVAFLKKNLEDMFPESRRMQCMIYPTFREGELIRSGIIKGRGWGYEDGEELCARIKPVTERERTMLLLGNSILERELKQVLNIEIYPEAVCVVYPNGLTKVYR